MVRVDNVREICPPTSLAPDICQIIVENVQLTVNFICQAPTLHPVQNDPGSRFNQRLVLIVLWYACWALVAFFLHIFVGRYLSRSRYGVSRPQNCRYQIPTGRGRVGPNRPSILERDGSPFPFSNASDDVLTDVSSSINGRGRRASAIGDGSVISRPSPLAGQLSARNSLSINGSNAFATNSHSSPTSQNISNSIPSTSSTTGGSAAIPHPNTPAQNVRNRRTYRSGTVRSKSHRRARHNATLNVFEPQLAETTPLLVTLLAWTTIPTPPPNNSSVFEPRPADSARSTPLLATLYPGLGDLTKELSTKWFIFVVVAVTSKEHGVIDPEFDLAFLQKVFGQPRSKNVRFEWLAEGDATLENIQAKLEALYCEARESHDPFRLCVYLTGIGNGNSKMCLFGGEVASEQELGSWTLGLHDQSAGNQNSNSISAIFDYCRETMKQRDSVDHRLGLVWSSSVGIPPSANACSLGDGLPMSCLLMAPFSVANDVIITDSNEFGKAIQLRLKQIAEFLRFRYNKQHETNEQCEHCKTQGGRCPLIAPQVPEWDAVGLDMLAALAGLIKTDFPEYALEVSQALLRETEEHGFLARSNDSHLSSDSNQAYSVRGARSATPHFRGANKQTSQTVRHMG